MMTMMVQVYYTTTPNKPLSQWDSQFVDNNKLTTISDLTPHTIYTIRSVILNIAKNMLNHCNVCKIEICLCGTSWCSTTKSQSWWDFQRPRLMRTICIEKHLLSPELEIVKMSR